MQSWLVLSSVLQGQFDQVQAEEQTSLLAGRVIVSAHTGQCSSQSSYSVGYASALLFVRLKTIRKVTSLQPTASKGQSAHAEQFRNRSAIAIRALWI
jgi:hypothetical protein